MHVSAAIVSVILFIACASPAPWVAQLKEADVIFQTSRSAQSRAIQRATGSRYSHMGIVLLRGGRPCVFEAVSTVRCTPVETWVARGEDGHFVVKRLRNADSVLGAAALERVRATARGFEGRPYDPLFGWSDKTLYCSELVWKIYDRALGIALSAPRRVGEFNLADPLVSQKARERFGGQPPLDEPAVAPSDIYASTSLVTVVER